MRYNFEAHSMGTGADFASRSRPRKLQSRPVSARTWRGNGKEMLTTCAIGNEAREVGEEEAGEAGRRLTTTVAHHRGSRDRLRRGVAHQLSKAIAALLPAVALIPTCPAAARRPTTTGNGGLLRAATALRRARALARTHHLDGDIHRAVRRRHLDHETRPEAEVGRA